MYESDETIYFRFLDEGANDDMRELMRRHRESLTLFLYGIVHDMEDAEELMLDAFVTAGMGQSIFYGKSSFKTWLFAIGRNQALKHLQKKGRRAIPSEDAAVEAASEESPERELLRKERDRILYLAMTKLNPDYRQILHLIYFEDMSPEEAGRVMRKNRKQIYNLIQRSREALRQKLLEEGMEQYLER